MALPTILVNSATGSDSAASGAGPATALTGASASTNGTGLVVTLDGSPDLSGVAVDGSHVIYLADTTAGARNFGKITAKDAGAFTVTVSDAFGLSLSGKSWAIGGKRASISSTTSKKLFDNNSTAGDAMPGWTIQMESGHSETGISAMFDFRRAGDTTSGSVSLIGEAGLAEANFPLLQFNLAGSGAGLRLLVDFVTLRRFRITNSNATKNTPAILLLSNAIQGIVLRDLRIGDSTNNWQVGIKSDQNNASGMPVIVNCEVAYCSSYGIQLNATRGFVIRDCFIHDNGDHGIYHTGTSDLGRGLIANNLITHNGGDGIHHSSSGTAVGTHSTAIDVLSNTIAYNTSDGYQIVANAATGEWLEKHIDNNIFAFNGGYGINASGTVSAEAFAALGVSLRGNNFYSNTSGAMTSALDALDEDSTTTDPQFTDESTDDFSLGTNLKAAGVPSSFIGSNTSSFVDPGAAQREEPAAGGGLLTHPGMSGGCRG